MTYNSIGLDINNLELKSTHNLNNRTINEDNNLSDN